MQDDALQAQERASEPGERATEEWTTGDRLRFWAALILGPLIMLALIWRDL
jgi:hypothetical protein